jgi:N-acyl-D-amino-acid deacylase
LRLFVLDEGFISLPFAVRGMTSLATTFLNIPERGLIKERFFADLAVFNLSEVRDRATFEDPHQYSEGTVHVLVNGAFALRDGQVTGTLAGRGIRRGGRD